MRSNFSIVKPLDQNPLRLSQFTIKVFHSMHAPVRVRVRAVSRPLMHVRMCSIPQRGVKTPSCVTLPWLEWACPWACASVYIVQSGLRACVYTVKWGSGRSGAESYMEPDEVQASVFHDSVFGRSQGWSPRGVLWCYLGNTFWVFKMQRFTLHVLLVRATSLHATHLKLSQSTVAFRPLCVVLSTFCIQIWKVKAPCGIFGDYASLYICIIVDLSKKRQRQAPSWSVYSKMQAATIITQCLPGRLDCPHLRSIAVKGDG